MTLTRPTSGREMLACHLFLLLGLSGGLSSCAACVRGSALEEPLPAPSADFVRRPIVVDVEWEGTRSRNGSLGYSREFASALEGTGYVMAVAPGTPGALSVRADIRRDNRMNVSTYVSLLTLTAIPGYTEDCILLIGEIRTPEGQRHRFTLMRSDHWWSWLPLMPIGVVQYAHMSEGGLGWFVDDLPAALVGFMLAEGIL